jgi:hypothetical protein
MERIEIVTATSLWDREANDTILSMLLSAPSIHDVQIRYTWKDRTAAEMRTLPFNFDELLKVDAFKNLRRFVFAFKWRRLRDTNLKGLTQDHRFISFLGRYSPKLLERNVL